MRLSQHLLTAGLLALVPALLPAQGQVTQPGAAISGGGGGDYRSTTTENMTDRLFNVNSDSVDMENGSMQWKGKTFNLGNTRLMRARFERYLAAPVPAGDTKRYLETLSRIEALLAPNAINDRTWAPNQQAAFDLLFEAARYEADADNSLTLASQVRKVWEMRREFRELGVNQNQLDALRKKQEGIVINRAEQLELANDERASVSDKKGKGGAMPAKSSAGTTELGYRTKDEQKTQAEIVANQAKMTALALQAQVEFQSQIVQYLLARRYRHCILACAFYRVMFKSQNQNVRVGAKEVKEFFPISDYVPSLESLDGLCREAINDVAIGIRTTEDLFRQGEVYGAFERLQETFFLGEYEPAIQSFDPARKRELLELWRDLRELQRVGDERDLANVDQYLNQVSARAKDFPAAAVRSKVESAKSASSMQILAAQQAAVAGDAAKAEAALERAAKYWPLNPAIRDFASKAIARQDVLAQKIPEFDRLHTEGKWREIFNKRDEFAVALIQDKDRLAQLKAVVTRVGEIEAILLQASSLAAQGNPYLAWDLLQRAGSIDPNDLMLARTRSDIAPMVADYARLLAQADRLEKEGHDAAALTAWMAAQELNPVSEICGTAVKRLATKVAGSGSASAPGASRDTGDVEVPEAPPADPAGK
jgi:hypothetical protein